MADSAPEKLSRQIREQARRLGFDHCRIIRAGRALHADFFDAWLDAGRSGEMTYLERNREQRRHPSLLLESAAPLTMIVLAVDHFQFALPAALRDDPSRGVVASYAWGEDYHDIMRAALHALDEFIRQHSGRSTAGKCLVDTGPVLERDWAQRAGIGFTGKNCCTIHPASGSWMFLATILVPDELACDSPVLDPATMPSAPADVMHGLAWDIAGDAWQIPLGDDGAAVGTCGRCTRCLVACPTAAFVGPYHLQPQRCISYWTIESRQPIPVHLRPLFGNRVFGCDICQEVCPWNRRLAPRTPLLAALRAHSERIAPPLLEGFDSATPYWIDAAAFDARFRRSPIKRAKRSGMLRNVCVAMGNWAAPQTVAPLTSALHDPEPLARGHAAWALGRVLAHHRDERAAAALTAAQQIEGDEWVQVEIYAALHGQLPDRDGHL